MIGSREHIQPLTRSLLDPLLGTYSTFSSIFSRFADGIPSLPSKADCAVMNERIIKKLKIRLPISPGRASTSQFYIQPFWTTVSFETLRLNTYVSRFRTMQGLDKIASCRAC